MLPSSSEKAVTKQCSLDFITEVVEYDNILNFTKFFSQEVFNNFVTVENIIARKDSFKDFYKHGML